MGPINSRPKSTHLVRGEGRLFKLGVGVSQEAPFEGWTRTSHELGHLVTTMATESTSPP
jgi:hypothetical protein